VALHNRQSSFINTSNPTIMDRTVSVDSKEKPVVSHVEHSDGLQKTESHSAYAGGEDANYRTYDKAFEKRVIRKVDIRLLIILGALYSIALIDRTNLSAARVAGMAKDLRL
jgi:hypothetical protein